MDVDAKLEELFVDLPEPRSDREGATPIIEVGKRITVVGQLPWSDGRLAARGRVGLEVALTQSQSATRLALLQALGQLKVFLKGSLNTVKRVIRFDVAMATGGEFRDHEQVVNGSSDLLNEIFGKNGVHARSLIGVISLPHGSPIQVTLEVELK